MLQITIYQITNYLLCGQHTEPPGLGGVVSGKVGRLATYLSEAGNSQGSQSLYAYVVIGSSCVEYETYDVKMRYSAARPSYPMMF
jgi:hypothetical protein